MNLIKKNFDIVFLLLGIALYVFQAALFPVLLLAFVFLWYRREVLWRVKHGKAGSPSSLFNLNLEFNLVTYIWFWLFGVAWCVLISFLMMLYSEIVGRDIVINYYKSSHILFYDSIGYLYPGHLSSEPIIAEQAVKHFWPINNPNIPLTAELLEQEINGNGKLMLSNYHMDFIVQMIYLILFARLLIMQPIYQVMSQLPNHQLKLQWNWYKIIVYSALLFGLYYLFFFLPIHREVCPTNKAGWLCTDLATSTNYIEFPARIMAYWTVILFFFNIFLLDYIKQEQKQDNTN